MFTRILAATDGSEEAGKAVRIATDLAIRHDCELVVVHVVSSEDSSEEAVALAESEHLVPETPGESLAPNAVPIATPPFTRQDASGRASVGRAIGQRLVEEARHLAAEAGARRVRTLLEFADDPASAILAAVRREGADAVVVGTRGRGRVAGLLLGSVSQRLASECDCTCIVVR
jgi:nucleotide-binding universal stress UspA family protein